MVLIQLLIINNLIYKENMDTLKNILITVGVISIILFITLLVIGVKVVSAILLYVVGAVAAISLIGLAIFYIGKLSGKADKE